MRQDYKVDVKMSKWQRGALDPIDGSGLPPISISANVDGSFWSPDVEDYHAEIQVTRDLYGKVCRVFIQPLGRIELPDVDPNEPIPYEVTDEGKFYLEEHRKQHEKTWSKKRKALFG